MSNQGVSRLVLIVILIFFLNTISAQNEPGFNYQAVARENSDLLSDTELDLKLMLYQGGTGGELLWEESHTEMTNAYGLFSMVVGSGTSTGGGSAATFQDIDWSGGDIYLKVDLKKTAGGDWISYPASMIQAVPYALHALSTNDDGGWVKDGENVSYGDGNIGIGTSSPGGLLTVQGLEELPEEPLFMVRRKDGYPVFAVYEDGVYAYTDTVSTAKGVKGGFAVGGYNASKKGGDSREYMRITADSIRFYVDDDNSKGVKGGFAVGGYNARKAGGNSSFMQLTPENYFIGHEAGTAIESGLYNSFIGYQAGSSTTNGNSNAFIGHQSGQNNSTGWDNVFLGPQSGLFNTTGYGNVYLGKSAGQNNQEGMWNVFIGQNAGLESQSEFNVFVGAWAGNSAQSASNVFVGGNAGSKVTIGGFNTFLGAAAGTGNTTGAYNTIVGAEAGRYGNGTSNVFVGTWAGDHAGGYSNVYVGRSSASGNETGIGNVAVGTDANANGEGSHNVFLGVGSGVNTEGNKNVFIGANSGENISGDNKLVIENSSSESPLIYGEFNNDKVVVNGSVNYGVATGTDTYTADIPSISYYPEGLLLYIKFQNENTGQSTLNINGIGARWLITRDGFGLSPATLKAGRIQTLIYDGTYFQLLSY